tara:strand:- start:33154 stop:33873 length:720 start_codon:yes stop_codon:yes gene_type:complete
MATFHGPKIVSEGIAYCIDATCFRSFNGVDGSASWVDIIGNSQGTLTNGPGYEPENGGYINFDGSNDFHTQSVSFSPIDPSNGLTMMGWYKLSQTGASVLLSYSKPSTNNGMRMQFSSSLLSMTFGGVADYTFPGITSTNMTDDKWRNICITIVGTTASAYIDGELNSSISVGTANITDLSEITISKSSYDSSGYFNGGVSSAYIYNRALTSTEIKQIYNSTKSRFRQDHQPSFGPVSL